MSALKIKNNNGHYTMTFEEQTPENQRKRILELNERLDGSWYAMTVMFSLATNDNGVRLLKRWSSDRETYFREMPVSQWKLLLILLEGQKKL